MRSVIYSCNGGVHLARGDTKGPKCISVAIFVGTLEQIGKVVCLFSEAAQEQVKLVETRWFLLHSSGFTDSREQWSMPMYPLLNYSGVSLG